MTFQEYIDKANTYHRAHPDQRLGQAFTNVLTWTRGHLVKDAPDVWELDDSSSPLFWDFMQHLDEHWNDR